MHNLYDSNYKLHANNVRLRGSKIKHYPLTTTK